MKQVIGSLMVVGTVVACSGGGGSGGGSSKALSGTIQVSKAGCNGGKSCLTGSSISSFTVSEDQEALAAYTELNGTVIPALNGVIARIEKGIAEAGVNSCDFIGDDDGDIRNGMNADLPLEGTTESGATFYKVSESSASIPALFRNPYDPTTGNNYTAFTKHIAAKDSVGAFLEIDLVCNLVDKWEGVTNDSLDSSPLIAKVLMIDRSTGNKINAYYMKGVANNRLLLAGKIGSKNYKVFFTTKTESINPMVSKFELSYADGASLFEVGGLLNQTNAADTQIIGSKDGGTDTCYTSSCNLVAVPATSASSTDLLTGGFSWSDALVDASKLVAPTY